MEYTGRMPSHSRVAAHKKNIKWFHQTSRNPGLSYQGKNRAFKERRGLELLACRMRPYNGEIEVQLALKPKADYNLLRYLKGKMGLGLTLRNNVG